VHFGSLVQIPAVLGAGAFPRPIPRFFGPSSTPLRCSCFTAGSGSPLVFLRRVVFFSWGLINWRNFSKLRQSAAFYYAHGTVFCAGAILRTPWPERRLELNPPGKTWAYYVSKPRCYFDARWCHCVITPPTNTAANFPVFFFSPIRECRFVLWTGS
jgi:hypothetical protein